MNREIVYAPKDPGSSTIEPFRLDKIGDTCASSIVNWPITSVFSLLNSSKNLVVAWSAKHLS